MLRRLKVLLPFLAVAAWLSWRALSPTSAPPEKTPPPNEHPEAPGTVLHREADATEVFRRAFWREPSADDRILHAERREWVAETDGVRRWQWFLTVKPGPDLLDWLITQNAFNLSGVPSNSGPGGSNHAPTWFPRSTAPGDSVWSNSEGSFWLSHDPKRNLLHATDSGGGFARSEVGGT